MTESLHRELTLQAPVGRVWRALTDSTEIAHWMYSNDFKPESAKSTTPPRVQRHPTPPSPRLSRPLDRFLTPPLSYALRPKCPGKLTRDT
jgi:hypothetical protein